MNCYCCKNLCVKKGKQKSGIQKYYCKMCKRYQQEDYLRKGWKPGTDQMIVKLLKESCGIRSIGRVLEISPVTVIKRIKHVAQGISKPFISINKEYEVDELKTYMGKKHRERWLTYAVRRDNRDVADFRVGTRTKKNLGYVIQTLILS